VFVNAQTGGAFGTATPIAPPSSHYSPVAVAATGISCPAAGSCVAVGNYAVSVNYEDGMYAVQTNGSWQTTATEQPVPSSTLGSELAGVSCASASSCVAVGDYETASATQALLISGGVSSWTYSTVTLPSNANNAGTSHLNAVSCTSDGSCVAVGDYLVAGGGEVPMVATDSGSGWEGTEITQPQAGNPTPDGTLNAISCTSAGNCAAGGSSDQTPFVAIETDGTWGGGETIAPPQNAASNSPGGTIYGIACGGTVVCSAVGQYASLGFETDSLPALAITTSSLPTAYVDVPYSAQLAETGGSGNYIWSIEGGSLPTGLTVDPSTGMISGTATNRVGFAGELGVKVIDAGPPVQSSSALVMLDVQLPPPPGIELGRSSVSRRRHSASFRFSGTGFVTTFECALVKRATGPHRYPPAVRFFRCTSPKTYRHLRSGSYSFRVRAQNLGGASVTASHSFKIA
jgi:hypothetical protein